MIRLEDRINVIIVDDHQIFLEGILLLLRDEEKINVIATVKNAHEAIKVINNVQVDIVITDYDMPQMNGLDLGKYLKKINKSTKIILLTSFSMSKIIIEALKYNIEGYLLKNTGKKELLLAIEKVYSGKKYFSQEVKKVYEESIFSGNKVETVKLSSREKEVLFLITKEKKTHEIAEALFISFNTVETHRKNLMKKIGTNNLIGLFKYALKNNLM